YAKLPMWQLTNKQQWHTALDTKHGFVMPSGGDCGPMGAQGSQRPVMRLGVGAKFTLPVLVILACTMAASTLYFLKTSTRFHEKQLEERGRALGRLIALVSPEAILGFDYVLLNDYT